MRRTLTEQQMQKIIPKAIESALGVSFISAERITKGEINKVYRIKTSKKTVLLRIFRMKDWISKEKIEWMEQKMHEHRIPHAKLLYFSNKDTYFPYGFMVTEFIEGQNCAEAITTGKISFDNFHKKLGTLLRKVHSIKTKDFGDIPVGKEKQNFLTYTLKKIRKAFKELKPVPNFDKDLQEQVIKSLIKLLKPFESVLKPVLTHGDPSPDNCILTLDGEVVLIDWDTAKADIWVRDYADIRLNGSHMTAIAPLEERRKRIKKTFLATHTKMNLSQKELEQIEHALYIIITTHSLPYYYNLQKNYEVYNKNLQKLKTLLA